MREFLGKVKKGYKSKILKLIPKNAVLCEIGVWKGDFSKEIFYKANPQKLYLIDPWKFYPVYENRWYGGKGAKNQKDMDKICAGVEKYFEKQKKVVIYRETSKEALKNFESNYFDFIYIDGNHSYEYVKEDLKGYLTKMKKGGIIAGDDYFWYEEMKFPIRKAVREFVQENNFKLQLFFDNFVIRIE